MKRKKLPPIQVVFTIPGNAKLGEHELRLDVKFPRSFSKAKKNQWCDWIDKGILRLLYE